MEQYYSFNMDNIPSKVKNQGKTKVFSSFPKESTSHRYCIVYFKYFNRLQASCRLTHPIYMRQPIRLPMIVPGILDRE